MRTINLLYLFSLYLVLPVSAQELTIGEPIFPLQTEHTHGSTIVELPNGDLLAAWFQGTGERWADDVRIMGARLPKGKAQWTTPFIMADVPDFPDINPVLFLDTKERLWLVWYTVIANQWETSLLKYRISDDYQQADGPPSWQWQDVIHVKPGGSTERGIQADDAFARSVEEQLNAYGRQLIEQGADEELLEAWVAWKKNIVGKAKGENMVRSGRTPKEDGTYENAQLGYPYFRRMGWQTKNKAVFVGDRMILPLYSDGLEMTLFAITDDLGQHWSFSTPVVGIANIQAGIAKKADGTLVAYMRDNGPPPQRHPMSYSKDNGLTWSPVEDSELLNPGSGSDVVTLANGHWLIAYNDTEDGRHSLAVSISTDEGKSWGYTRHLLLDQPGGDTGAYPSVIQGKDGRIHVVYSFAGQRKEGERSANIIHAAFEEDWVMAGDADDSQVLKAGAALRKITPDPLLPVSGGVGIPKPATEKKGDLYVRALVLEKGEERIAIVNIDNLGWPSVLGNKSRALIKGILPENILIGATHTHSGPDAYAFPDEQGNTRADLKYLDWCVQQIADAVNEALDQLEPVALKIAEGEAKGKIAYNYYAERLYDPRCNVIQAIKTAPGSRGEVLATLVNYAIHPEVIGSKRGILSPDLCGPLYERIEAQTGGMALFMNGAQGGMVTADNRSDGQEDIGTWEECIRIGHLLADEALRIVKDAPVQEDPALHCMAKQVEFPIDSEMMRFILKHSPVLREASAENKVTTQLNLLQVGTAQILTIPGEALPNIGYYLKRNMKGQQNMLFGLTNDAFGYILSPEDFNSFERYQYISATSLGERTGEILIRHALQMIGESVTPARVLEGKK
jgi:predicted neuraminidase